MGKITLALELPLRVVIYPAPDVPKQWIAHCLETDIVTQGDSVEHALDMMADALWQIGAHNVARGRFPVPLRPAPSEVWELARRAKGQPFISHADAPQPKRQDRSARTQHFPSGWPLYAFVSKKPPSRAHAS